MKEESFTANRSKRDSLHFPSANAGSLLLPLQRYFSRPVGGVRGSKRTGCPPPWMYKKCEWIHWPCISRLLCCTHLSAPPACSKWLTRSQRTLCGKQVAVCDSRREKEHSKYPQNIISLCSRLGQLESRIMPRSERAACEAVWTRSSGRH